MMKWLRKHRYTIFLITVVGFLVGSFMGFGSYFFSQSPYDAAIVVNGEEISYKRYQLRYRQYLERARQNTEKLDQETIARIKQETLQDLVRETVFLKEAENYGVIVTNNELAAYIQQSPAFQRDGKFDQTAYLQVVHQILRMPMEDFEEDRRRELMIQKMQTLMASSVKIGHPEYQWYYERKMVMGSDEEKKVLKEKPGEYREQLRREQVNNAFQEWLGQVNSQLKVKVFLHKWEGQGREAS